MKIVKLTENVAVSAQITPENVAEIAAAGYKVLVNNRPDGEEANQPGNADIAAAAKAAGLEYHYMPITAGNFPGPDFGQMRMLLDDTALPVLAFCRSGTRCANLWVASRDDESSKQARALARQLGYDLSMSTP
ncbi:MAG TPA: TIGR01244 family phosphatase [Halieaceae bacterium]|nr:MAG: TIGR01244 family phosphatase [Gammaproteobacteria bacterium]HDY81921.1 TIGR01244 family phosphatase [Halieaceae bacterium]